MLFLMPVFCLCFNYKRIFAKKQEAFFNYFQKHYEKACNIMKQKYCDGIRFCSRSRKPCGWKTYSHPEKNSMQNGSAYRIQNSRIKREGSEFLLRRTLSRNFRVRHVVSMRFLKEQIRYRFRPESGLEKLRFSSRDFL